MLQVLKFFSTRRWHCAYVFNLYSSYLGNVLFSKMKIENFFVLYYFFLNKSIKNWDEILRKDLYGIYVKFWEIWEIFLSKTLRIFNLLSVNPTKWPNTLKQFVGNSFDELFLGKILPGSKPIEHSIRLRDPTSLRDSLLPLGQQQNNMQWLTSG